MESAEIVVVGSYNRDIVLSVERLPEPGETCFAIARAKGHGGKGSNQALQAALCGARVAIVAAVGDDAAGDAAFAMWAERSVDARHAISLANAATGTATVVVDALGENSIIVDRGANALLSPSLVDAAAEAISKARLVLAQLETPAPATLRAFEIARRAGVPTFLNAAPAPKDIDPDLLALTDVLFVNRVEAAALAGSAEPAHLQTVLLPRIGRSIIMTLGGAGAVMLQRDAALARPAIETQVVDTTGAGDAFIGAFAARIAASGDFASALDWGVAAGALACSRRGAVSSFSNVSEIARLADTGLAAGEISA